MIKTEHAVLWNRLRQFSIDDPVASVKFSDKLAFHNHWSPGYTQRVIEEYKKFVFLCCISPTGASPSGAIDEAWHLHLTYTHNYWKEFCPHVLGMELHHHPSRGGAEEKQRHLDWYAATLSLYREVFGSDPPEDIWPPAAPAGKQALPPGNEGPGMTTGYRYLLFLLIPFFIPLLYGKISPFHLNGPHFLVFFAGLILAGLWCLYLAYRHDRKQLLEMLENYDDSSASIYQVTRYAYGQKRSLQTAIVDLADRKILESQERGSFTFFPSRYQYSPDEENPLIQNLLKMYKEEDRLSYGNLESACNTSLTEHAELSAAFRKTGKGSKLRYIVIVLVLLVWSARSAQAVANDRPAAYLFAMASVSVFLFVIIYAQTSRKHILGSILSARYKNRLAFREARFSLVNQFAFGGIAVLSAAYLHTNMVNTFGDNKRYQGGDSSASDNSGCGSSCGGSCGGGCGGCGGGD